MGRKYTELNDPLYDYILKSRSHSRDPILDALEKKTAELGDVAAMQISPEQGTFLTILVQALGVRSAIEIGTFTGYSSLCIARGLPDDGRLLCLDASREWTDIARPFWEQAGVRSRIELKIGPALKSLAYLEPPVRFDFAFVDAEKTEYDAYYENLLPRMKPNGVILFDNMLWGGRLGSRYIDQASGQAIDMLNAKLALDSRVDSVLLPIADGIQMCRVKAE